MEQNLISIFPNLTYKLHNTVEEALKEPLTLFVASRFKKETFETFYETRIKYAFIIVDCDNKPYQLVADKWKINTASIRQFYYYSYRIDFDIVDPLDEVRNVSIPASLTINGIITLCEYINQFKGFDSWKHYDLFLENKSLHNEINYYKQKNENCALTSNSK